MTASKRKKLLAGNWKMNVRLAEVEPFFTAFSAVLNPGFSNHVDILFAAPFTQLHATLAATRARGFAAAAQNMHFEASGAFTGEVSAMMLTDIGIRTTLVGHSERRQHLKETDEIVAMKIQRCQENSLNAIVCIGEQLEERESGHTHDVLKVQLDALKTSIKDWSKIVIAYEPVWAIGTGKTATPEIAQEAHEFIRKWI